MSQSKYNQIKVLHLPKWYPDKFNPTFGLFIQKHIYATTEQTSSSVIYVCPDPKAKEKYIIEISTNKKCLELRVYYSIKNLDGISGKILKLWRYWRANKIAYRKLVKENRKPDICHVHVLNRPALLALFLKISAGIPYIVSEHWSGYFKESPGFRNPFKRKITNLLIKASAKVTTVSNYLKESMLNQGLINNYEVINNIIEVDSEHKSYKKTSKQIKIVCLARLENKVKNISDIIDALAALKEEGLDFHLDLIGVGKDKDFLKNQAIKKRISKHIYFHGKILNDKAKDVMAKANFLILNSHYETFGVAPLEALSVGVPIIVTDCGGPSEYFKEDMGLLIPKNNLDALIDAIRKMSAEYNKYSSKALKQHVIDNFNPNLIGNKFIEIYNEILKID